MDTDVLDRRLDELWQAAKGRALAAVRQAPDGQWIAASEWPVREVFAQLTRESYQAMIQAKSDAHPTADQAAFSPGGRRGGVAEQGVTPPAGADGRR